MPCPGLAFTPQIVFSASCNWPNTPLAPNNAMATAITVPTMPFFFWLEVESMICPVTSAALLPEICATWALIFFCTSGWLCMNNPNTEMINRISGASENTV